MNNSGTLLLVGRILLGALFIVAGARKIMMFAGSVGYLAKLGFPAAEAMTVLSILIEIGGGGLLLIGWQTKRVAWLMIAFVAIATFMACLLYTSDAADERS